MIYVLFVAYQSAFRLPESYLKLKRSIFTPVVFDNSFSEEFVQANRSYCEENKIVYRGNGTNVGLSKAYNLILNELVLDEDYLVLLDADTNLPASYFVMLYEDIIPSHPEATVFSPINVNQENGAVDSPLKIVFNPFFSSKHVDFMIDDYDFFKVINNGLMMKGSTLRKINGFDENIFLYFSDSYLSFALFEAKIKTFVVKYKNQCNFSFNQLEHQALLKRLRLMKKDGYYFYKLIYKRMHKAAIMGLIHYQLFCIKKAKECSSHTGKKHFFSYLFSGKEKRQ